MAATTTPTTLLNAVTTTQTSAPLDLRTIDPGTSIELLFANGGTGPTTPAQMQVQVSNNWNAGTPTNWSNYGGATVGPTGTNTPQSSVVEIQGFYQAAQVIFTQSSGGTAVAGTATACTGNY